MPIVKKMLLVSMVIGMVAHPGLLRATILNSSYYRLLEETGSFDETLFFDSTMSGAGTAPAETLSTNEILTSCDLDPKHCSETTAGTTNLAGGMFGATQIDAAASATTGRATGGTTENPGATSLLLLLLGLIGLSRLRGRHID